MQKKLLALAVAGALSAPLAVQAQGSNVKIYGFLKPSVDRVKIGGDKGTYVQTNNSLIGFSGTEDLGGGLKAIFQIESQIDFDERGDQGTEADLDDADGDNVVEGGADGAWARRDSWLGLSGAFGSLTVGNHQSAYVRSTASFDPFADTIGDYNNIIAVVQDTSVAEFNNRYRNSFYYTSPSFGGFQILASYALGGDDAADDNASDDDNVFSIAGTATFGPATVVLTYENQQIDSGAQDSGDSAKGLKLGALFKFGQTQIGVLGERIDVDEVGDRNAVFLSLKQGIGNIDLLASVAVAGDMDAETGADGDDGAKMVSLGVAYNFSKRTQITGLYSHVSNDDDGFYGMDSGGYFLSEDDIGESVSGFSVRLSHRF